MCLQRMKLNLPLCRDWSAGLERTPRLGIEWNFNMIKFNLNRSEIKTGLENSVAKDTQSKYVNWVWIKERMVLLFECILERNVLIDFNCGTNKFSLTLWVLNQMLGYISCNIVQEKIDNCFHETNLFSNISNVFACLRRYTLCWKLY